MATPAYISHALPGRLRLKIPKKRGNRDYFNTLKKALSQCPGVAELRLNRRTASVLILYAGTQPDAIADYASEKGLFLVREEALPNLAFADLAALNLNRFDSRLQEGSRHALDMRSLVLIILLGLAVRQIVKGNIIAAPAVTLLWHAYELLSRINPK